MPAGKRPQTDPMLYYLITFVGLFLVATTLAVIFYIKIEGYRTTAETSKSQLEQMATPAEQRKGLGKIVGSIPRGKSALGTMADYLDKMVYLIIGGMPEDTSAEVKIDTAGRKVEETLKELPHQQLDIRPNDPNANGLVRIIQRLNNDLSETTAAQTDLKDQINKLRNRFDDAMAASFEKEQTLLAEKEKYEQQVRDIKKDYDELKALTQQTADQQVRTLMTRLDEEKANSYALKQDLLKTKAHLEVIRERMNLAQEKLSTIVPPPDSEAPAFQPDGKILLIDNQTKIAHLNIGSNDHVYPGLTFSVYDKNFPIPKDGKGKAELEVFDIANTFSAARIIRSEIKRPIVVDDIVANLIWDSDRTNVFVVAGEFDLDDDGYIDYDGTEKIKALITKWGGKATDEVTIDVDYLVLGRTPIVQRKPTFEQMEADPMALEKYEASLQKLSHYKDVQIQAQEFSIPVFNTERFLYFIGYKTQATKAGAWSF
jgi:hypothetical protein